MKNLVLVALSALAFTAPAFAGANISINANSPSRVLLDDAEVGQVPTALADVAPGFHSLRVENLATHEVRVYDFYSPATAAIHKDIAIEFSGASLVPAADSSTTCATPACSAASMAAAS